VRTYGGCAARVKRVTQACSTRRAHRFVEQKVQDRRVTQYHAGVRQPRQRAVFGAADALAAVAVLAAGFLCGRAAANLRDKSLGCRRRRGSRLLKVLDDAMNFLEPLVVAVAILSSGMRQ
jgi:hypothetical protein